MAVSKSTSSVPAGLGIPIPGTRAAIPSSSGPSMGADGLSLSKRVRDGDRPVPPAIDSSPSWPPPPTGSGRPIPPAVDPRPVPPPVEPWPPIPPIGPGPGYQPYDPMARSLAEMGLASMDGVSGDAAWQAGLNTLKQIDSQVGGNYGVVKMGIAAVQQAKGQDEATAIARAALQAIAAGSSDLRSVGRAGQAMERYATLYTDPQEGWQVGRAMIAALAGSSPDAHIRSLANLAVAQIDQTQSAAGAAGVAKAFFDTLAAHGGSPDTSRALAKMGLEAMAGTTDQNDAWRTADGILMQIDAQSGNKMAAKMGHQAISAANGAADAAAAGKLALTAIANGRDLGGINLSALGIAIINAQTDPQDAWKVGRAMISSFAEASPNSEVRFLAQQAIASIDANPSAAGAAGTARGFFAGLRNFNSYYSFMQ